MYDPMIKRETSAQLEVTCSKSKIQTPEDSVKHVQSYQ